MNSEAPRTVAQEVSDAISECLFKAKEARGIIIAVATPGGGVMTFGAGDFVTKLGLYRALQEKGTELWDDDAEEEDTDV